MRARLFCVPPPARPDRGALLAAYYVAFGPHGPRAPIDPPGTVPKILASIVGVLALTTVLYSAARATGRHILSLHCAVASCIACERELFANADSSPRSPAAAKDDDQGVAGGLERACDRPEDEPHLRYAAARSMCRRVLTVDVSRDPRWGRVVEGFGEDTYLNAVFAAAAVRGYQGESLADPGSILACAKHYVGYGAAEGGRERQPSAASGPAWPKLAATRSQQCVRACRP